MRPEDEKLFSLFPTRARELFASKGMGLIQQIGLDVIRGVVVDVMCGKNLRDSTEMLTRRRLAMLNAATLVMLLRGQKGDAEFALKLPDLAAKELKTRRQREERWLLQWVLGLTDKGSQNVLRDRKGALEDYKDKYLEVCQDVIESCRHEYGELEGSLFLSAQEKASLNWAFVVQLLNTVGAQTLAIRGSEKSTYGKLFERLVLGSLLHILGFEHVPAQQLYKTTRVFWLSSRAERRESDATLLYDAGKGARFDIGFIGRGNPEISLDKISRFEREIEYGRRKWYMATIIIVDRIGEKSNIERLAKRIDGKIVQMSMAYWPKVVAQHLNKIFGMRHELLSMSAEQISVFLKRKIQKVPLESFLVMK